MTTQTYTQIEETQKIKEDFLSPQELFLLGFLKSFDRKTNRMWEYLDTVKEF